MPDAKSLSSCLFQAFLSDVIFVQKKNDRNIESHFYYMGNPQGSYAGERPMPQIWLASFPLRPMRRSVAAPVLVSNPARPLENLHLHRPAVPDGHDRAKGSGRSMTGARFVADAQQVGGSVAPWRHRHPRQSEGGRRREVGTKCHFLNSNVIMELKRRGHSA